jgi:large subunit ribosomal protein L9
MKVILLKDVEKLGRKGEVKKVADGYGRNYLIPNKLAVLATKSELVKLEEEKKVETEKAEEELKTYQEIASQIDGLELEITAKVAEEGKLFGAVTTSQIAEKIKEQGFEIKKEQIKLDEPIKEIGEYEATIEFPHNLETKIKIIIVEENKDKSLK